jgi:GNAT superfamily N-acetyltransferase
MIIRPVEEKDIPEVIHLGGLMHDESDMHILSYSPQKIADTVYSILDNPKTMMGIVAREKNIMVGMFSAYIGQPVYSEDYMAWDIICYVLPEFRGSRAFIWLIRAYKKWAESTLAKMIFLTHSSGVKPMETMEMYKRLGFMPIGGVYRLEV